VFDATTSAAVQAFQRWSGITTDGLVGDQTWAALVGDTGMSLEAAIGLEHATGTGLGDPHHKLRSAWNRRDIRRSAGNPGLGQLS